MVVPSILSVVGDCNLSELNAVKSPSMPNSETIGPPVDKPADQDYNKQQEHVFMHHGSNFSLLASYVSLGT